MSEDALGTYCQNCTTWNPGDREVCRKCGTRLLIVTGDHGWDDDEETGVETEEDLDEHLLERITGLEESLKRIETYLETVSDQLGKLERSEVMLRNGLMSLVQEMEQNNKLDAHAFTKRWESAVEENLQLLGARELFTRYRARILPIAKTKSMAHLRRALLETTVLLDNSQLPEAVQRLEEALHIDPKNYELLFTVAALKEIIGDSDRAIYIARRVVQLSPRHYEAWMLIAKIAQDHLHQIDRAIEALRTASDLRPEELEPKMAMAELFLDQDDLQEAFEASKSALEMERNGDTLSAMGEIHIARGEYSKAIQLLKEASEYQPGEINIRELLAEGYFHASDHQKSFAILHDLLRHNPGDPELLILLDSRTSSQLRSARGGSRRAQAWLDRAEEWLQEENQEEAKKCLQEARKITDSDRAEWIDLQIRALKDISQATPKLLAFSTSQCHPRLCFNALRLAVDFLMTKGDSSAVMQALNNYLDAYPKSSGAWECAVIRQAFLIMTGKATEKDLAEVKRLQANPLPGQESRATTLLGQYLLDFHHPQEVIDLIVPKIQHEPTLINYFQLGSALAAAGQNARALEILRLGRTAIPGDLQDDQLEMLKERLNALIQELENV
ncbi:MAG: tetratricopeptide repeat protein [Holophagales bacterium]|jgi:tetratricopeptide (TPR) repeat protein|nr:tetratricopeptide repeat protein [Holophagales bacterium]